VDALAAEVASANEAGGFVALTARVAARAATNPGMIFIAFKKAPEVGYDSDWHGMRRRGG
jgi:hypothetical protein